MKKYIIGMFMAALVLIAALPQQISAAVGTSDDAVLLEKAGGKSASVKLRLSNASGEKISSLQFSLKMKAGTDAKFEFGDEVRERATVFEPKYDKETGIMNVYIAGNEPLYREGEAELTLGTVSVDALPAEIIVEGVGIVRGNDVEELDSLTASITLKADPETPAPEKPEVKVKTPKTPKMSKVTNAAAGISVKWSRASNASGYYVWRKTAGKKWSRIAAVAGIDKVSYTDKTVKKKNGVKYFYTVQAYNSGKTSGYNKKGLSIVRMNAPSISKPKAKGNGKMLVKWKRNKKASGYVVQYSTSSKFKKSWVKERVRSGKITSLSVSDMRKNRTYYVRIRSYKNVGGTCYYSAWGSAKKVNIM